MEQAGSASRLRYLDAADVDDSVVSFDGLDVLSREGDKVGDIDGFLVDPASGRVLHAVIDSGGWFTSRRFLLPIGHAASIDREAGALRCDLPRETLQSYPRFDEHLFREFTDADSAAFEKALADACCPDDTSLVTAAPSDAGPGRRHHQQPPWWRAGYAESRLRPVDVSSYRRQQQSQPDPEPEVIRDNPGGEGMQNVLPQLEALAEPTKSQSKDVSDRDREP